MKTAFIVASCMELAMGMLEMCKYEFPMKRMILWIFFFIYLLTAIGNKYTNKEKMVFGFAFSISFVTAIYYKKNGVIFHDTVYQE